jgi:hypothetical protein
LTVAKHKHTFLCITAPFSRSAAAPNKLLFVFKRFLVTGKRKKEKTKEHR